MDWNIINTDCMAWLERQPDASINCVVTSPPYFCLRDFGGTPAVWDAEASPDCRHSWSLGPGGGAEPDTCGECGAWRGALGLEPTPDLYAAHLVAIFRQCRRVLTGDGTLWLNLGDSYARSPLKGGSGTYNGRNGRGEGYAGARRPVPPGLKPKDLIGIPWRVAHALQADGWWLRADVIWEKPDALPDAAKDRPTRSHEYLFLLTKSERYYYDAQAVSEAGADGRPRNRRTVWRVPKSRFDPKAVGPGHVRHSATFPPELALPCVLAGCPPGGVVLDPFCGSASTGVACARAGGLHLEARKDIRFVGLEINADFARLGEARLASEAAPAPLKRPAEKKLDFVPIAARQRTII